MSQLMRPLIHAEAVSWKATITNNLALADHDHNRNQNHN